MLVEVKRCRGSSSGSATRRSREFFEVRMMRMMHDAVARRHNAATPADGGVRTRRVSPRWGRRSRRRRGRRQPTTGAIPFVRRLFLPTSQLCCWFAFVFFFIFLCNRKNGPSIPGVSLSSSPVIFLWVQAPPQCLSFALRPASHFVTKRFHVPPLLLLQRFSHAKVNLLQRRHNVIQKEVPDVRRRRRRRPFAQSITTTTTRRRRM